MTRALWVTAMWPDEARPWHGSFVYSQARSLQRLGIELDTIYIQGYLDRREYARGVRRLAAAVRKRHYDVVHAHYGWCGVVGRLQTACPLVISYCGDDLLGTPSHSRSGEMTRSSELAAVGFAQLARVAAATITKSEEMAERLPAGCRKRNHVIPNGVDLDVFAPRDRAEARQAIGWDSARPNVLFVGNPQIPRKNFRLAESVCQRLTDRGHPVNLRVGWDLAPDHVPVWMNASDVLLFPSLSEGSPNTIKEAMAVALPIVTAAVGDVPERLSGVAGAFVVKHDADAMADAVLKALRFPHAPAAREAVQPLSTDRVAERVIAVYEEVRQERRSSAAPRPFTKR